MQYNASSCCCSSRSLIVTPRNIFSCGPFFESATFSFPTHPDYPLDHFLHGKLGIVKPSFYRTYLVLAYRYLDGHPLNPREIAALEPLVTSEARNADSNASYGMSDMPSSSDSTPPPAPPSQLWLLERAKALGDKPPAADATIDPNLNYADYQSFLNCPDAAFTNAVATLHDREQKWGAGSADLKTWVAGQDIVFAHCSKHTGDMPSAVTTTNVLLQRDRDYQVASALFYSGASDQLLQAVDRFDEIGHDKLSPWETMAPYLAARSMIRAATLKSTPDHAFDAQLMTKAEARLKAILNNRRLTATYPICEQMLGFVEVRLRPEQRAHEIAQRITNGTSTNLAQDVIDFRYLLDNNLGNDVNSEARKDDLTDWVRTFQSGTNGKDHAVSKWRDTRSLPWLVAAVVATPANDPAAAELLDAAAKLNAHDPRLLTLLYYRALALHATGKDNDARALIDANTDYIAKETPVSSRNLFWAARLSLAQSYDEFLRFAPREDAENHHAQTVAVGTDAPANAPADIYFDTDSTAVFNHALPLPMLADAATSAHVPKPLQANLAQSTWTRALLLQHYDVAANLAPAVKSSTPTLSSATDDIASATTDDARHRAVLWTLLHNPGLRPYVVPNMQRLTEVSKIDNLRDNWWCADLGAQIDTAGQQYAGSAGVPNQPKQPSAPQVPFLTPDQKSVGETEWNSLLKLGAAPNYLGASVLAWAKASPNDPRIPEALHLVVRAGHYGCTDANSRTLSKQAFQLLHSRYPASDWTKKTPYYY